MNVDEYRAIISKKRNKYGAVRSGGYASRKEHGRALVLKAMQRAGEITDLREQVCYILIPVQRVDGRIIEKDCRYIADFVYRDRRGNLVVEDTKGYRTKEYIIKRKLMLYIHGIAVKEI